MTTKIEKYGTRNLRYFSFSWASHLLSPFFIFFAFWLFACLGRLCVARVLKVSLYCIYFFQFPFSRSLSCLSPVSTDGCVCVYEPRSASVLRHYFLMDFLWLFCYKCNQVSCTNERHTADGERRFSRCCFFLFLLHIFLITFVFINFCS